MAARDVQGTSVQQPLLPGLPDHVALLCLLRVPRQYHASLSNVCVQWNWIFKSSEFFTYRKKLGIADSWLFVTSTNLLPSSQPAACYMYDLASKQLLWKVWSSILQRRAGSVDGFKFAAIDEKLLVIGGNRQCANLGCKVGDDQLTIFNTATNKCSQGAKLQIPRCNFASGVIDRSLYVAGGYNENGTIEQSTEVYNLEDNEWSMATRMPVALKTIDCEVVFRGKLYVRGAREIIINNNNNNLQQESTILVFDPVSKKWEIDECMSDGNLEDGELVATENCVYNLSASDVLHKYDEDGKKWEEISSSRGRGVLTSRSGTSVKAAAASASNNNNLNRVPVVHTIPRAFGLGKEIFLLTGDMAGPPSQELHEEGVVCHNLYIGTPSLHREGAIIQA